jgi:DNA-binding NarL/FixJ family response regulator
MRFFLEKESLFFGRETNIEIVCEASMGDELISFLQNNKNSHPDIIIMNLKNANNKWS